MTRLALAALLVLSGCETASADAGAISAPILLDRHPERLVDVALPERSREDPPERIEVSSPWRAVTTVDGVRTWEAELPVRLRTLFFSSPPDDLAVYARSSDTTLRHARAGRAASMTGTWEFGPSSLRVRRRADQGPPQPGEYQVRYERATTRERELNLATSGMADEAFLFRSLQVDDTTRHGLLLPAPASATFEVDVPAGGVLTLNANILPPEADDLERSDGATLVVSAGAAGAEPAELQRVRLERGGARDLTIALDHLAGQRVHLRFHTEPGATTTGDYVFLAEPTVYAPQQDPPRVVLIFVDTLRHDHLSIYGYPRDTTPNLAELARSAAVFEQARSIAPWTLPSARTMVTGVVPERWKEVESLPQRFARAGWATAFLAGNTYLSSNFEIDRDWGIHRCINWPRASIEIDRALDFLADNEDKPVFMLVHLMDQHLPYKENLFWRYRFAGARPKVLSSDYFLRTEIQKLGGRMPQEARQHLRDRYDNNLAYVDAQLTRLFDALDLKERDTAMLISDHGEEFWDHGGFEHGHSLYDELLHVPAVLVGPGVAPGRYAEPVSMLDVAPTLAQAAGLPLEGMEGWPLQTLIDGSRSKEFADRPQAFGRPLYGDRLWGALDGGQKLIIDGGQEEVFDILADPREDAASTPAPALSAAMREAMSEALGTPVAVAWRVQPTQARVSFPIEAELTVPGGVAQAWVGEDPTKQAVAEVEIVGDTVTMRWKPGGSRALEVFVVPTLGPTAPLPGAVLSVVGQRDQVTTAQNPFTPEAPPPEPDGKGGVLLIAHAGVRSLALRYMSTPLPVPEGESLRGFDAEVAGELKALGYWEEDEPEPEPEPKPEPKPTPP